MKISNHNAWWLLLNCVWCIVRKRQKKCNGLKSELSALTHITYVHIIPRIIRNCYCEGIASFHKTKSIAKYDIWMIFLSLYVRCSRCFFFFFFWWRCLLRNANENKTQFNHSTFQENYRVYQQNPLHKCYLNCTGETPIFSTAFAIVSVVVPFDSCLDNISIVQNWIQSSEVFFFVSFSMVITCAHVLSMFCV